MEVENVNLLYDDGDAGDNNPSSDAHDPPADHDDSVEPENSAGNVHLSIEFDIKF